MNRRQSGKAGEDLAVDFLLKKGYRILARNYRFGRGEMDIIADERGVLVFVEVKARWTTEFGAPEEAVSCRKQARLRNIAEGYLLRQGIEEIECRFDVVAIGYGPGGREPAIDHIEGAF